jgi:hypothetical protein
MSHLIMLNDRCSFKNKTGKQRQPDYGIVPAG